MKATVFVEPGKVEVRELEKPVIEQPTDALIRVIRACVCGSDLWWFRGQSKRESGSPVGHEAIVAVSYFVTAIQTVVSRRIDHFDTASVTIGSLDGVGSFNAIKDSVTLKGDVRIMKESTRIAVKEQLKQIADGIATMFTVQVSLDYDDNYPVLYNDPAFTTAMVTSIEQAHIKEITSVLDSGPQDPSEDFAYFVQAKPSSFIYVGAQAADGLNHPHHSPDFLMNEDAILIASKAVGAATLSYLQ